MSKDDKYADDPALNKAKEVAKRLFTDYGLPREQLLAIAPEILRATEPKDTDRKDP